MANNKVQFQEGISLPEFIERFGTEEKCEQMLFKARWPNGFICEKCEHDSYCYIKSRRTHFSATAVSIRHRLKATPCFIHPIFP